MAARVTPPSTACLHLNPSMALASFSLSLLIQVHEAAALVESGGDAGIERRPPSGSVGLLSCLPVKRATLTGVEARHGERLPNPAARRLLLVEVHLRFANVDSRPIRVRRASQVPQGRVPRGVHGEAR